MTQFKMHPLHTNQEHLERMRSLGADGYHKWLDEKRCTGRSTAQALELLAKAIRNPGKHIDIEDHANLERGLGSRHKGIDIALQDLVRSMAQKLGLEHIHTHARSTGPTVVFERRLMKTSVPPVSAPEVGPAVPEYTRDQAAGEIRRLMRQFGWVSAHTLSTLNGEGQPVIQLSRI